MPTALLRVSSTVAPVAIAYIVTASHASATQPQYSPSASEARYSNPAIAKEPSVNTIPTSRNAADSTPQSTSFSR